MKIRPKPILIAAIITALFSCVNYTRSSRNEAGNRVAKIDHSLYPITMVEYNFDHAIHKLPSDSLSSRLVHVPSNIIALPISICIVMIESRCDPRIGAVLENAANLLPGCITILFHSSQNEAFVRALPQVIKMISADAIKLRCLVGCEVGLVAGGGTSYSQVNLFVQ
jgi:hypothetical protein